MKISNLFKKKKKNNYIVQKDSSVLLQKNGVVYRVGYLFDGKDCLRYAYPLQSLDVLDDNFKIIEYDKIKEIVKSGELCSPAT